MRSYAGLFEQLIDGDFLDAMVTEAVRGKRRNPDVAWFLIDRDVHVQRTHQALRAGEWRPSPWIPRFIRDPKPRVIAVAPVHDRVVHRALVELLGPIFEGSLSDAAFACRRGRGTHRALLEAQRFMRRNAWFLHLDVRSYFPSIRVPTLRSLVARRIRDRAVMELVDRILEAGRGFYDDAFIRRHARMDAHDPPPGCGVPIGALTSQLFAAHVYLGAFDHWVQRTLRVPGYIRYVDDLLVFGPRRAEVESWREEMAEWLWTQRGLRLKSPQARVRRATGTLRALGHEITRHRIRPFPRAFRRWDSTVEQFVRRAGRVQVQDMPASVASRVAHLLFPFGAGGS